MNAERLLAHYEKIADTPDAIARLRRFILDLAVRGKLVPQDAGDEPASDLLKRIAKEKARLVKAGEIRKENPLSPISQDEQPFDLPFGWVWTRLGDLIHLVSGQHLQPPEYSEDPKVGLPYITGPSDFAAEGLQITRFALVRKAVAKKGQLLLTVKGSGVGKTTTCDIPEVAISRQLMALTAIAWDDRFLVLITHRLAEKLQEEARSLIPGISREDVEEFVFPLPPLAEQHRIVAKVDELMALCDRLEAARAAREVLRDELAAASLARLNAPDPETFRADARFALDALPALTARPDQIKQLRQTILNLAVRGKLVPQDPKHEPASELLNRIAKEKTLVAKGRGPRNAASIRPLRDESVPFQAPSGWVWAAFGDIVVSRDGERIPVSKEERRGRAKLFDYYGASGVIDQIDNYLFDKPLLLIGEDGANLINRSTPIAFIARGKYWVNNHAHVLDGLSEGFLRYVELFINAIDLKPYVTGTAQPKMNQAKMNSIPVAVPPLAEQYRIAAKVDELMALCDRLEASLAAAGSSRHRLLGALLADALEPDSESELEAAE